MKKLLRVLAFVFCFNNISFSDEITDTEWLGSLLTVTYYHETAIYVECTAYNSLNKPIGGAKGFFSAKVARPIINTPSKYSGKKLKIVCKTF